MKKFLIEERKRDEVGALGGVKALEKVEALLFLLWDLFARPWLLANLSYYPKMLAWGLM